jgi:di/tricarboxylate transporter
MNWKKQPNKTFINIVPYKYLVVIFPLFLCAVYFMYKLSERKTVNNFNVQFRGEITKITKRSRGRYDLEVGVGTIKIILSDYNFGQYKNKISIGDSLIKSSNTDCFYYKGIEYILAQNCSNISKIDTLVSKL